MNKAFSAIIMAAAVFASCAKSELEILPTSSETSASGVTMSVIPSFDEGKTAISQNTDGTYTPVWTNADAISMSFCASGASKFNDFNKKLTSTLSGGSRYAKFSGVIYSPANEGNYDFFAVYPHSSVLEGSAPGAIRFRLPQAQIFGTATFDPFADILFSKKQIAVSKATNDLKNVEMSFARVVSMARIKVDGSTSTNSKVVLGEQVVGVSLSTDASVNMTGVFSADPSNPFSLSGDSDLTASVSGIPSATVALGSLDAVLAFAPFTLPAGSKLTISIRTLTMSITKTVTLPADSEFNAGVVKALTCSIDDSWTVQDIPAFSGGSGTEADPYLISYPADLQQLSVLTNGTSSSSYVNKFYRQTADIDMSKAGYFTPISNTSPFTGSYDGAGYAITNLDIVGTTKKPTGLFAAVSGGSVSNLHLRDFTVQASGVDNFAGTLAGNVSGSANITGCSYEGDLISTSTITYIGGLIGQSNASKIRNCTVNAAVKHLMTTRFTSDETETLLGVGGIFGNVISGSDVDGCTFKGRVYAYYSGVGGIAGHASSSIIENCVVEKGSEISSNENRIGGIVGYQGGSNMKITVNCVKNCTVSAIITGRGYYLGGIIGYHTNGHVQNCLVTSDARITTYKQYAGGVSGRINCAANSCTVSGCAVYCDIQANYHLGGISGCAACTTGSLEITNCAYIGGNLYGTNYTGSSMECCAAGIVGYLYGASAGKFVTIANCYSRPGRIGVNKAATSPCISGIASLINNNSRITCCYSDLNYSNILYDWKSLAQIGLSGNGLTAQSYGDIYAQLKAASYASGATMTMSYVYYLASCCIGLNSQAILSTGQLTNCESFTSATAGAELVAKLNAGVAAYNATSPAIPAVEWVVGADGYATLSGILGNPSVVKTNPKRISTLGDSISTFRGYIPSSNGAHYPTTDGALDAVSQTYWWKLAYEYMSNAVFEKNISFSGTTVCECNRSTEGNSSYQGPSYNVRILTQGLGDPDIILLHGGTNDYNSRNITTGDYIDIGNGTNTHTSTEAPSDEQMNAWFNMGIDELDVTVFCPAYIRLIKIIQRDYPRAKVVCIIGDRLCPGIEKSILKIADHYDFCRAVDLYAVNGFNENVFMPKHDAASSGCHPGAEGHAFIANKIYSELGAWLEE